jgi:cell wall-associated NlpC family hydrolase
MFLRQPARRAVATAIAAASLLTLTTFGAPAAAQDAPPSLSDAAARAKAAATSALAGVQHVAHFALSLVGVDYRWGGTSPATGLDCSGLVQYVFQHVTGVTLPRTAREMSRLGEGVTIDDLEPGDLVFFNTRRLAFSHVGIYLGDNRFIHAPRRGREVEVATIDRKYWQKRFNGARRLAGLVPGMLAPLVSEALAAPMPSGDEDEREEALAFDP